MENSFFFYLYGGLIVVLTFLGSFLWYLKKKWGNVLFLSQGELISHPLGRVKVLKVVPFMGESYLLILEIETKNRSWIEIWSYTRGQGFKVIKTLEDSSDGGRFND
jgi:hypothetical protein